ncbi:GntR family transcriptional regulator [Prauserella alba]|uniref:GntR family transcriptional regulator n=1 Tax=Prauserella alba TaxID=176898 RepID=A0ABN1V6G2_9PSEU|nr:GntR family transcriptional regulator [Prauserella alba]MCP2181131.1 DNA-binding transcriptional regulator, GntR family [Prauserella alba]
MTFRPQVDVVYEQLRSKILDGSLEQGYDLHERAVAELVGTSRTPVREAVARLVVDGLAERHGRRTRVTVWDDEKTGQLYEMRAALESEACRLAAMRRSESVVMRLQASVAEQRKLADPSPVARRDINYEFHEEIWQASGNPFLLETNQKYGVQSMCIAPTTLRHDERWKTALDEHERLVEHISRHEAGEAAALMHHHLASAFRRR